MDTTTTGKASTRDTAEWMNAELFSDLESQILAALSALGGRGTAANISRTIRTELRRSASIGRVYLGFGALVEGGLVLMRHEQRPRHERSRMQTVAHLTERGWALVRQQEGYSDHSAG
jgi:hypothetical protein